ncbi:phosphoadenosine phosphosulfate reductase family protein [Klebsiella quasipneumoniae subsp. quasipneumoniae]|uniref:phosphoadenosine phosphosulfate reductase domain-containing protein n=1 Tax=Klebsiella quasipneumoniae TaxID=1463165 RepID=UPI0038B57B26
MIPDISSLITAGALFVSNHSGGKDSQAMLIKLLEIVPTAQLIVVHASLGVIEWPGALDLAEKQAGDAGLTFIVARASKTFFEMVERRFENRPEVPSWPSASTRQCTSDLKRGPIQREVRRYAKANGYKTIVNCLGLRAQESPGRAKRQAFSKMGISNSVNTWYEWLPVHDLLAEEVSPPFDRLGKNRITPTRWVMSA